MPLNSISLALQAVSTVLFGAWAVREWWAAQAPARSRAALRRARIADRVGA